MFTSFEHSLSVCHISSCVVQMGRATHVDNHGAHFFMGLDGIGPLETIWVDLNWANRKKLAM